MRVIKDRVLLKLIGEDTVTESGIIISLHDPTKVRFSNHAEVMITGPDCKDVKVGDRILIPRSCGTDMEIEGEHKVNSAETEILGVVTK